MSTYTLEHIARARVLLQSLSAVGMQQEIFNILNHSVLQAETEVCKDYPLDAVEKQHVNQGDNIPAIKHYKDRLNVSLYAAKLAVDYYRTNKLPLLKER